MSEVQTNQEKTTSTGKADRYLVFILGEETYAMPLLEVREVIAVPETTAVPNSPEYFSGIMNLRGQVISIFDLRKKLNIKPMDKASENAVIIIDINGVNVGIVVDEVNSVQSIGPDEMGEAPQMEKKHVNKYLYGVARKNERLVLLIELKKVLDIEDFEKIKAVA